MSRAADVSKLEFIVEMISDIENIIKESNSITSALENRIYKAALLMALLQIGETLNKIKTDDFREQLPIKGAYDVRNFIAHDYEGVDLALVDYVIRDLIPTLRKTVDTLLEGEE